ncbi:MAG: hypothetical protein M1142_05770 [Patescibacteria group bacterium]|nr:hypothetical protein [Patescibacteria group bacterium]
MQKGTATLFLVIIVLIIVGLISLLFLGLIKPSPSVLAVPKIWKTPVQTLQIQTYNDNNLGLAFQYPKDFQVKEDSEEEYSKRGGGNFRRNFANYVQYEPGKVAGVVVVLGKDQNYDNNPFSVWVFDNPDNLIADKWFDKYWYYPFLWGVFDWASKGHVTPDEEVVVAGQTTKYKIVLYQPGSPKYLYLSNQGRMYLLRIIGENGEKILSGFKFLQ